MKSIYTKYYEFADLSNSFTEDFLKMFQDMLLQTNGDLSRIFQFLERYNDEYKFFTSKEELENFKKRLEEEGFVEEVDGRFKLSPKGKTWLKEHLFKNFFKRINLNHEGQHNNRYQGKSQNIEAENRPFRYGDDFRQVDYVSSVKNAYKRSFTNRLNLHYDDLEVKERLGQSAVATILLVDISHSMILYGEDRITPAKKVALALCELIKNKYPNDKLHVCVFGNDAWEIPLGKLDEISVGPFHTNTLAALELSKKLLKKYTYMDKQIILITDGKPTCLKEGDTYYKNSFGLDPYIVNKVLKESIDCKKQRIAITTFMLN